MDCVCVCAPVASYLLLPGHSVDTHSKKPLVVIHSVTRPWKKKFHHKGKAETKREESKLEKASGVGLWPDDPYVSTNGRLIFSGIPHTGRHISAHTVSATLPQLPFIWIHLTERHQ